MFKVFRSSVLAGVFISLGCIAYLKVGGLEGAILFSFGIIAIIHYGLKLYTGTAGFFKSDFLNDWITLVIIVFGNFIGCFLTQAFARVVNPEMVDLGKTIIDARMNSGIINSCINAVACGLIMTTAVQFGKKNHFLPLLFGIPLFIMCGFTHSIADSFYFLIGSFQDRMIPVRLLALWSGEIFGNFIGCNIYRMLCLKNNNPA